MNGKPAQLFVHYGNGTLRPVTSEERIRGTAEAKMEEYRRVQVELKSAMRMVSQVIEIFGKDVYVTHQNLRDRPDDEAVASISRFINTQIAESLNKGTEVVGIALPQGKYAEFIAPRTIRGPKIYVSIWDDSGQFVEFREIG